MTTQKKSCSKTSILVSKYQYSLKEIGCFEKLVFPYLRKTQESVSVWRLNYMLMLPL